MHSDLAQHALQRAPRSLLVLPALPAVNPVSALRIWLGAPYDANIVPSWGNSVGLEPLRHDLSYLDGVIVEVHPAPPNFDFEDDLLFNYHTTV